MLALDCKIYHAFSHNWVGDDWFFVDGGHRCCSLSSHVF